MENNNHEVPETMSAFPTKRFFVGMFTRDIELQDAILDLLDNCVDGIQRVLSDQENQESGTTNKTDLFKNYEGFWSKIEFDEEYFRISDNCGGIPPDSEAFRLGNPIIEKDRGIATIGYYGIGMKRAIFKMGRRCTVTTKHQGEAYRVTITPEWLQDDTLWQLPVELLDPNILENEGTVIEVRDLYDSIANKFSVKKSKAFLDEFQKTVSTHYSYIMHKGFEVSINSASVEPQSVHFQFATLEQADDSGRRITPFVYEGTYKDVQFELVAGFYRNLPSEEEIEADLAGRNLTERAGWTVICNDRVVVYNDKDKLTGWGEASVPKYHTQFVSIAGIVKFSSTDIAKLPLTTTKRGVDAASDVYLTVKNIMRDALKIFTSHTNKWKAAPKERAVIAKRTEPVEAFSVSKLIKEGEWVEVKQEVVGRKFVPKLPEPIQEDPNKTIKFSRPLSEIRTVADFIFGDTTVPNALVGEECFKRALDEALS